MEYDSLLLHCCCAPCSSAIVEYLVNNGIRPTLFFSNSNIVPREEYDKRRDECIRYARALGLETVEDDWDHGLWLECIRGLENEPERGGRCLKCFGFRLSRAADYAAAHGFKTLATTLAASRWKNIDQVNEAGIRACEGKGVEFWARNWRKGGLQERRNQIIREMNFYNQTFCGCEFGNAKPPVEDITASGTRSER